MTSAALMLSMLPVGQNAGKTGKLMTEMVQIETRMALQPLPVVSGAPLPWERASEPRHRGRPVRFARADWDR